MSNWNILITDDHPVFRRGLKSLLRKTSYFNHIYEVSNGKEAVALVEEKKVDLVMMDIDMKVMNGIEASKAILKAHPDIGIIAMTMFGEPTYIQAMQAIGAKGYLLKDDDAHEINRALVSVLTGKEYYSPKIRPLITTLTRIKDANGEGLTITKAQEDVLKLLCEQLSNEEIAEKLNLSVHTIKRHRRDLLARTRSINLAGLVRYAIAHGKLG